MRNPYPYQAYLCACGKPAVLEELPRCDSLRSDQSKFYVRCEDELCWRGPIRATREDAVGDWNLGVYAMGSALR